MKSMHLAAILTALILLTPACSAQTAKGFRTTWRGVTFETPVAFSTPRKLGLDAAVLVYPKRQKPGKGAMELTLAAISPDMRESFGNDDAAVISYVASTFLGASGQAQQSSALRVLEKEIAGHRYHSTIPATQDTDLYLIPLPGGGHIALALTRRGETVAPDNARRVLEAIARTFTPSPAR